MARAERWRKRHPQLATRLAYAARLATWVSIPVYLLALVVVPDTRRSFVVVVGVLQLLLHGFLLARSKTLSWGACARTMVAGALLAPAIGAVSVLLTAALGWTTGEQAPSVALAGPVEETLKLAPVGAVLFLARNRARRMAVTDLVLLGLAAGAGFQLAEDTVRRVVTGSIELGPLGELLRVLGQVPDVSTHYEWTQLWPGWQSFEPVHFPGHGVLTAFVAGGLGLAIRGRRRFGRWVWAVPGAFWLVAVVDHAMVNLAATELGGGPGPGEAAVSPPSWLVSLHRHWGGGREAAWLLFGLVMVAVIVDHRAVRRVEDRLPPLPGRSVASGLAAWSASLAQRIRAALPSGAAPSMAGLVGVVAGAVRDVGDAMARAVHELHVSVAAAGEGRQVWFTALPWLRERRELAQGIDRARGGPRRHRPAERPLLARGRWLRAALLGGAAVLLVVLGVAAFPHHGPTPGGFLAGLFEALGAWWGDRSLLEQIIITVALAGLLTFGGMSFLPALSVAGAFTTAAEHGLGAAAFIRNPGQATRDFIRNLTPAEAVTYVVAAVLERLIPAAVGAALGRTGRRFVRRGAHDVVDVVDGKVNDVVEEGFEEAAETTARKGADDVDVGRGGGIHDPDRLFTPREREIAEILEDEGRHVEAVPTEPGVRTPDALIDDVPTEFKSLDPGASNVTVRSALVRPRARPAASLSTGAAAG